MNLNSYHSVKHLYLQYNINLNLKAETIKSLNIYIYIIKLSWTWGKEKISQHTSGFQKKKIKLHQNKNQFTYWKRYKWKGNPQMKKIFTVHISEKQNDTINREKTVH